MSNIVLFLGMAGVTFLTRYSLIALLGRRGSPFLWRFLNYIPVTVLTSLIALSLFPQRGEIKLSPQFVAFGVALLISLRTRKVILTLACGMTAYWLLTFLGW